jgi:hypothetical protein
VFDLSGYEEKASRLDLSIFAARAEASSATQHVIEFVLMMWNLGID